MSKSVMQNLRREIEIHSQLSHENIVKFLGHFYEGEYIYIILEYLSGGNLFHYIRNKHPLNHGEIR
jgi:serine/threonine protein kinase